MPQLDNDGLADYDGLAIVSGSLYRRVIDG